MCADSANKLVAIVRDNRLLILRIDCLDRAVESFCGTNQVSDTLSSLFFFHNFFFFPQSLYYINVHILLHTYVFVRLQVLLNCVSINKIVLGGFLPILRQHLHIFLSRVLAQSLAPVFVVLFIVIKFSNKILRKMKPVHLHIFLNAKLCGISRI